MYIKNTKEKEMKKDCGTVSCLNSSKSVANDSLKD